MSDTFMSGFEGVSIHMSRVSGRRAERTASGSSMATAVPLIPHRGRYSRLTFLTS